VPVWLFIFDDYSRTAWAAVASFLVVGAAALPLTPRTAHPGAGLEAARR